MSTGSRRRHGARMTSYVLNGVKWHVTSANLAAYAFFQAKLSDGPNAGRHVLFFVDMDTPGVECVRVPEYSPHLQPSPLGDEIHRREGPRGEPGGE